MKYKRILSIFFIAFFITFQVGNFRNEAKATAITAELALTSESILATVAPFAPQVALVAGVLVAGGYAYENKEEIVATSGYIYGKLKAKGIDIYQDASNKLSLTADYISSIISEAKTLSQSRLIDVSLVNSPFIPGELVQVQFIPYNGNAPSLVSYYDFSKITIKYKSGTPFWAAELTTGTVLTTSYSTAGYYIGGYSPEGQGLSVCPTIPAPSVVPTSFPDVIPALDTYVDQPYTFPTDFGDVALGDIVGSTDFPTTLENVGAIPFTGDTTIPVDIPIDLTIDVPLVRDKITNKLDLPRFTQTWNKLKNMDTSRGQPPKITIDLNKLFYASTSRFGSPQNPFPSKESTLIDFAYLQNHQFGGLPLIDYFRGLVACGFIFNTLLYVWRKITPKDVIS